MSSHQNTTLDVAELERRLKANAPRKGPRSMAVRLAIVNLVLRLGSVTAHKVHRELGYGSSTAALVALQRLGEMNILEEEPRSTASFLTKGGWMAKTEWQRNWTLHQDLLVARD